jgi:hypothetical protein
MIDCEMELMDMHMYSFHSIGVSKYKSFRSKLVKRAPGVDMTLLSSILMVENSAVGVLTLSG